MHKWRKRRRRKRIRTVAELSLDNIVLDDENNPSNAPNKIFIISSDEEEFDGAYGEDRVTINPTETKLIVRESKGLGQRSFLVEYGVQIFLVIFIEANN